jgi:Fe-S cluster biogenesis protein NfuA
MIKIRRKIARRADRWLGAVGLVSNRVEPEPEIAWAEVVPPIPAQATAPPSSGLNAERVQAVLDEMVRPALQSDGGDITLIRVDGGDVYVSLVGACNTCPSATLTMKMGVEGLLEEELEGFERLIQIDQPTA